MAPSAHCAVQTRWLFSPSVLNPGLIPKYRMCKKLVKSAVAVAALAVVAVGSAATLTSVVRHDAGVLALPGMGAQDVGAAPGAEGVSLASTGASGGGATPDLKPSLSAAQNFHYALPAGQQPTLAIQAAPAKPSVDVAVAAVPLPGALWMFGTAWLGFLGLVSRRKV